MKVTSLFSAFGWGCKWILQRSHCDLPKLKPIVVLSFVFFFATLKGSCFMYKYIFCQRALQKRCKTPRQMNSISSWCVCVSKFSPTPPLFQTLVNQPLDLSSRLLGDGIMEHFRTDQMHCHPSWIWISLIQIQMCLLSRKWKCVTSVTAIGRTSASAEGHVGQTLRTVTPASLPSWADVEMSWKGAAD